LDTTGKDLIDHWTWAAKKGVMNPNTAGGLRAACTQVLSVFEEGPESVDIRNLDMEGTLRRFENLKRKDFKPQVLEVYKTRFRQAVKSYLEYLDDPGGWKPATRERAAQSERNGRSKSKEVAQKPASGSFEPSTPAPALPLEQKGRVIDYPFPLREAVIAHLWLPADLKRADVKRLIAFMNTLVMDGIEAEIGTT